MKRVDYAVIGAGASGMAAALILARQGFSVALVERAPQVAPLLRGFSRRGVHFDSGFHYAGGLGQGQVLSAYFAHLGVGAHLELVPEPVRDTLRLLSPHGPAKDIAIPYGYEALRDTLCRRYPAEAEGVQRYLDAVRAIFEATPYLQLDAQEEPAFGPLHDLTLDSALRQWVGDPELRHVLGLHHFFYGVPPEDVSFVDHARFAGSYYAATHFIKGGGAALAEAFEKALAAAGVQLLCGVQAQKVCCSPAGQLCGVRLDNGEELPCTGVVATLHPSALVDLAPEKAFRPAYAANLRNLAESPSAYMLFGLCDPELDIIRHGALHVAPRVGSSLSGLRHQALEGRQLFVAPAGEGGGRVQPLGVICPAPHGELDDYAGEHLHDRRKGYVERKQELHARLQALLLDACPELAGSWRAVDAATPLTFRRYAGSPTGSLYGVQHAAHARCPLPQTKLPGFYVAGQSVTGPGVLGATVSAYVACTLIVGRHKLLDEVRQCL